MVVMAAVSAMASPAPVRHLFFPALSPKPPLPPLVFDFGGRRRLWSPAPHVCRCILPSSPGGESVADDFVSTRKSALRREFAALATVLGRIAPLDTAVVAKGVSDAAKDSMKRTISTMLGLLPSDQFAVSIRVSRAPLQRLLSSSIITGYTLWNAEYRVSLMRNFENSPSTEEVKSSTGVGDSVAGGGDCEGLIGEGSTKGLGCEDNVEETFPDFFGELSSEALRYIEGLKSDLAAIEKKLNMQKLENMQLECNRGRSNDLLEYLRSLEPDMVIEISQPSSSEVKDIIQQLVQNILYKYFNGETSSTFFDEPVVEETANFLDDDLERSAVIRTSRDYLAKLLFWCMLLGHHMRGMEYRLHLNCMVGL